MFDWLFDIGDWFSEISDSLSITGIVFAVISAGFIYFTRNYMLNSFLLHMGRIEALIWGAATYIGCAVAGYFIGKHFEES